MTHQLDEEYFTWLYSQVAAVKLRNRARSHWSLTRQLYKTEFIWLIPNDDNRVEDGRDLRYEFLDDCGLDRRDVERSWLEMSCSMFEMLIGLARRLAFETESQPRAWFWHLIETLDLAQYNDRVFNEDSEKEIEGALDQVIWRTYGPDGQGGLFPLNHPRDDQREVEIWYQLSAYLQELL